MAGEASFGELKSDKDQVKAPPPETPFRIVIMGDFSGRTSRGEVGDSSDIANRKTYKITRENLDDIMTKLGVKLRLNVEGEDHEITVKALDHFHPDEVHNRVAKFNDLDFDDDKAKLMSALIHHPEFQAVEAAWRGMDWLMKQAPSVNVQTVMVDVSLAELSADLMNDKDISKSALYQLIVEKPAAKIEGQPWALLIGNYTFDVSVEHANVLGRMARIAREAAAPFLAGVPVEIAGKEWEMPEEVAPVWQALRNMPEASMLGLGMNRFLLRVPFGEDTKTIDPFTYEEITDPLDNKCFLWCNAAYGIAALLAMSFQKDGWTFKAGQLLDLISMLLFVYTDEDDDKIGRSTEQLLARKEGEKLAPMGLMHFIAAKGQDRIQLMRFQSLALPPMGTPSIDLLGQWGQKGAMKLPSSKSKPGGSVAMVSDTKSVPGTPAGQAVSSQQASQDDNRPAPAAEAAAAEPEAAAPAAPAEEAMDPELAALLAQLEGGGDAAPAAPAEAKKEEPPAEEAMDPELAALLAQLEGGDAAPAEAKKEEPPAEEAMDPELAALLAQLEGGDAAPAAPAEENKEEKPAEEEMDPELAALLVQLEGGDEAKPA